MTVRDHAMGALLGGLIGDAAGGVLEFLGRVPSADETDHALSFPGGGCLQLAPGQVTDDGELMLCLALGLTAEIVEPSDRLEAIARHYAQWVQSSPFDIGNTTMASLGAAMARDLEFGDCAAVMAEAAQRRCLDSKANGSLMRCMPLAIWGRDLEPEQLADWARKDSSLSHPNPSCTDSVAAYVIAMAHLIRTGGDRSGAVASASAWVDEFACSEVKEWFELSAAGTPAPFHPLAGFVKIAFTHAFHHLIVGSSFSYALRETLMGGGDTDTNACIVAALIGSADGIKAIPEPWRAAVLNCDTRAGQVRPPWLSPAQVPELCTRLLVTVA